MLTFFEFVVSRCFLEVNPEGFNTADVTKACPRMTQTTQIRLNLAPTAGQLGFRKNRGNISLNQDFSGPAFRYSDSEIRQDSRTKMCRLLHECLMVLRANAATGSCRTPR